MNQKATYFIEAALDAIKADILDQIRSQGILETVPCESGTHGFYRLVKDYHKLREMIGRKCEVAPVPQMECAEAMCETIDV